MGSACSAEAKSHQQLHIEENSTNHGYDSVLGRFLDKHVTVVEVEDPYIRAVHQCYNFLHLCELCVRKCQNLQQISLLTSRDQDDAAAQNSRLLKIRDSLSERHVQLVITFSDTLHDREIRLNNGWIVKIGRGLDYFKKPPNYFCLGEKDFDFRLCKETTVDFIHKAASE